MTWLCGVPEGGIRLRLPVAHATPHNQVLHISRVMLSSTLLDDWGLAPLTPEGRRDLLEILDDRHNRHSTVVTSQLPVAAWHEYLNEPTLADALLDRLVHNAYTLNLSGESMRRRQKPLTNTPTQ